MMLAFALRIQGLFAINYPIVNINILSLGFLGSLQDDHTDLAGHDPGQNWVIDGGCANV